MHQGHSNRYLGNSGVEFYGRQEMVEVTYKKKEGESKVWVSFGIKSSPKVASGNII